MSAQIHTLLTRGRYKVTGDSGAILDEDGMFATRRQRITFRGSESALISLFKVGRPFPTQGLSFSEAQDKMLCSGPQSIELIDFTGGDPHWDAEISWVGLHKAHHGSGNVVYRVDDEFSYTETLYPKEGTLADGSKYSAIAGPPYAPAVSIANNPSRVRIMNHVPIKKVRGVIFTNVPLSPWHGEIKAILTKFKASPPAKIRNWMSLTETAGVPEPQWNYAPEFTTLQATSGGFNANSGAGLSGDWVPSSLQVNRRLSVEGLYVFTMEVPWEQRVTPG